MFSKAFWLATLERAVKTAAQSVVLLWAVGDGIFNLWSADLVEGAGVALGGFVLSVVTSVATGVVTTNSQPSAVRSERLIDAPEKKH